MCNQASKGLVTYEYFNKPERSISKLICDYDMQKYDKQCEDFELYATICSKDSKTYEHLQDA